MGVFTLSPEAPYGNEVMHLKLFCWAKPWIKYRSMSYDNSWLPWWGKQVPQDSHDSLPFPLILMKQMKILFLIIHPLLCCSLKRDFRKALRDIKKTTMRHCHVHSLCPSPCPGATWSISASREGAGGSQLRDLHGGSSSRALLEISAGISSPLSSWYILLFCSQRQGLSLLWWWCFPLC